MIIQIIENLLKKKDFILGAMFPLNPFSSNEIIACAFLFFFFSHDKHGLRKPELHNDVIYTLYKETNFKR